MQEKKSENENRVISNFLSFFELNKQTSKKVTGSLPKGSLMNSFAFSLYSLNRTLRVFMLDLG